MDTAWSDADISMTSPRSFSFLSSEPLSPSPSFLTAHQNGLISAYIFHSDHVSDLMNTVIDLAVSVRRERDEPSLQYLVDELERAQEELVLHRDAKRRREREIKKEEEKLNMVVGDRAIAAKRQLNEIWTYMGREKTMACLR